MGAERARRILKPPPGVTMYEYKAPSKLAVWKRLELLSWQVTPDQRKLVEAAMGRKPRSKKR